MCLAPHLPSQSQQKKQDGFTDRAPPWGLHGVRLFAALLPTKARHNVFKGPVGCVSITSTTTSHIFHIISFILTNGIIFRIISFT